MKTTLKKLGALVIFTQSIFAAGLQAQTVDSLSGINLTPTPAQPAVPDSVVQITAEMQGLQAVPFSDLPAFGTYWEVMPGGIMAPLPNPCFDPSLPTYAITGNIFVVDATYGQLVVNRRQAATMSAASANAAAVQTEATAVANLIDQVQAASAPAAGSMRMGAMNMSEMDGGLPSLPGDGGTNVYSPSYTFTFDPGTNLWIAQWDLTTNTVTGIASNTIADVSYEMLWATNLLQTNWTSLGFIVGSEVTNWTAIIPQAVNATNNGFLRLRSWLSSDGSGIPDWWEALYGLTNVDPNAQDSAGDGYTIYQKYQLGINPSTWVTPAAPQSFAAIYNANNDSTLLSWMPSSGPVTGYTVQKADYWGDTVNYTLSANSTSLTDTNTLDGSFFTEYFRVQATYTNGNSAWSAIDILNVAYPRFSVINGVHGQLALVVNDLPKDLSAVRVFRTSDQNTGESFKVWPLVGAGTDFPTDLADGYFDVPVANITNGIVPIPSTQAFSFGMYAFAVQMIESNGVSSARSGTITGNNDVFIDGRAQLKDNLRFKLRAASDNGPFEIYPALEPTNYVYAGFSEGYSPLQPFQENNYLRNLLLNSNDLTTADSGVFGITDWSGIGMPNTGVAYMKQYYDYIGGNWAHSGLDDSNPEYPLSPDLSSFISTNYPITAPDSWLNSSESQWFIQIDISLLGGLSADYQNYWGLSSSSQLEVAYMNNQFIFELQAQGDSFDTGSAPALDYYDINQPTFLMDSYYFARPGIDPLPEQNAGSAGYTPRSYAFSLTNTTPLMMVPVGQSLTVAGYAKLAVQNANAGVYGYLGQYLDQAYTMTNGAATSTNTGVLSPYGNFLATQAGEVALVTMPDIDTGQQGTCTVYCVSLALDANHDGTMDTTFNGPDSTSVNSPFTFWANNNYDRWTPDEDDGTNYMDDVQIAGCPATPNTPTLDCNYSSVLANGYAYRAIPCTRDLEDFFRLWVCGINSNLLAALPVGSTVTLNWGDVGSPNSGNPTIDIFTAADPDGGIGYLTNEVIAAQQTNAIACPYIGRLAPGGGIQLNASVFANQWAGNHFIICGVNYGNGGLNLTIADASGNVLAQSTSYIQIADIKQMYERWTVGDNPNIAPTNVACLASENLPPGVPSFEYPQPQNTNTPYILFVHGWNMETWVKDRYAETAFKRLYWQGYQGRFGSFRWPTGSGFKGWGTIALNASEKDNFDGSEYNAWQSGPGLLNKLNDLNINYPGHVYLLAHSMGNVVAGEALRLAGSSQVVNTYVASQAAVSAHTYDTNVANYSFYYPPWSLSADTPNIYGNWFAGNNGGGAAQVVSFYNVNDFALQRSVWQLNELLKPDQNVLEGLTSWNYGYNGYTNDAAPWNKFYKANALNPVQAVNFDIVNNLTNRYEVMAYAAQPYTTALGATPGITNLTILSLPTIWPSPDPLGKNYASHFYHSAQFRGDTVWEWSYWNTLLFSPQTGFNISNP